MRTAPPRLAVRHGRPARTATARRPTPSLGLSARRRRRRHLCRRRSQHHRSRSEAAGTGSHRVALAKPAATATTAMAAAVLRPSPRPGGVTRGARRTGLGRTAARFDEGSLMRGVASLMSSCTTFTSRLRTHRHHRHHRARRRLSSRPSPPGRCHFTPHRPSARAGCTSRAAARAAATAFSPGGFATHGARPMPMPALRLAVRHGRRVRMPTARRLTRSRGMSMRRRRRRPRRLA